MILLSNRERRRVYIYPSLGGRPCQAHIQVDQRVQTAIYLSGDLSIYIYLSIYILVIVVITENLYIYLSFFNVHIWSITVIFFESDPPPPTRSR